MAMVEPPSEVTPAAGERLVDGIARAAEAPGDLGDLAALHIPQPHRDALALREGGDDGIDGQAHVNLREIVDGIGHVRAGHGAIPPCGRRRGLVVVGDGPSQDLVGHHPERQAAVGLAPPEFRDQAQESRLQDIVAVGLAHAQPRAVAQRLVVARQQFVVAPLRQERVVVCVLRIVRGRLVDLILGSYESPLMVRERTFGVMHRKKPRRLP